jgi:S1-C subfamily serine protease/dienelactone hydrolase
MIRRWKYPLLVALNLIVLATCPAVARADDDDDLDELQEKAIKAAVHKIAPCVVQIETSGGLDVIRTGPRGQMIRTGNGPTSGLIVSADGYIITSAFNFITKPAQIRVAIAGQKERVVATVVATDQTRMLTLLKVDLKDLPVPQPAPKAEIKIGHTALAVGRTLSATVEQSPSVSQGIISAVGRIWGKALQTDAKVSPTNYGGPLIDLTGRVQGVLVPASPRAVGETAGVEWYDSGIGFAIPLEDVNAVLPRLKEGKDLKQGILGVTMQSQDQYGAVPTIGTVSPGSAAEKGGLKPGDVIVAIDGKDLLNFAQMQHQLGSKYEGQVVTVKFKRGTDVKEEKFTLGGSVAAFGQAFLGILPMRDDAVPGVEIRFVYPKGPADTAKLQAGDRILKVGNGPNMILIKNRDQLLGLMDTARPGAEIKVEVQRKGGKKTETVTVKLGEMPDDVPDKLPEFGSVVARKEAEKKDDKKDDKKDEKKDDKKKDDDKKDEKKKDDDKKDDEKKGPETGLLKRTTAAADHSYWVYVPDNYDPKVAHAVVIWLHPAGKNKDRDVDRFVFEWQNYCEDQHVILIGPKTDNENGWTPSEIDFIQEAFKAVSDRYTVDRRRVVAHGMGQGGQMAFYMGFHTRNLIRGVATTGASLGSNPKEKVANQPLAFFVAVGDKDPLKDQVKETKAKLTEYKYSAVHCVCPDMGHEYLDQHQATLEKLVRWIDSLDRM